MTIRNLVQQVLATTAAVLLLGCTLWGASQATDERPPLADYFGFSDMEIMKLDWDLGRPLAGDINGDRRTDLVVVNNRRARIELLLQRLDYTPGAPDPEPADSENINDVLGREKSWRFKRTSYPLAVQATSVVMADLNGDQRLDLAYYSPEGLRIALQDQPGPQEGDRGLREPKWQPEERRDIADGLKTVDAMAVGDLNGDGRTDLVVLAEDGYYVLLQDAKGSLGKPQRQSSSSSKLRRLSIGDLNADGRCDLLLWAAGDEEYPLRVRVQRPDGTLGPEVRCSIPWASEVKVCRLADKDYVVSVSGQSGRVGVFALRPKPAPAESVAIYPLPQGQDPDRRAFAAADIDADGLTDVIVTEPQNAEFLVYRGQAGTTFASPQVFPGLKDMRKVCAAKLAEKGPESLVVLSVEEKLIGISRTQDGRLSFPQTVPVTGEPLVCDLADLDRDGRMDLAYVSKGQQGGRDRYSLHAVFGVGGPDAQRRSLLDLEAVQDKPQDLIACDIDGNGLTDVIVVRDFEPLLLIRQTEAGVFAVQKQDEIQAGLVGQLRPQAVSRAVLGPKSRTVLLLAQDHFIRSVYFDQQKGWQVLDQYQAGDAQAQLGLAAVYQARADGPLQIAGLDDRSGMLTFLDPQPDGTTRPGRQVKVPAGGAKRLLTGHFADRSTEQIVVCYDRKLGAVQSQGEDYVLRQVADFEPDIKDGRFGDLTMGDLNGDGVPEIVVCEQNRHHVEILTFDGQGKLTKGLTFRVFEEHRNTEEGRVEGRRSDSGQPRAALVSDVTGDGKNDLVLLVHDRLIVYPQ